MFGWIIGLGIPYLFVAGVIYCFGLGMSSDARSNMRYRSIYSSDVTYREAKSAQFLLSHAFIWPLMIYKVATGNRSWAAEYVREYELAEARKVIDDYERRRGIG